MGGSGGGADRENKRCTWLSRERGHVRDSMGETGIGESQE